MFDITCVLAMDLRWRDGRAIILFNFNEVQIFARFSAVFKDMASQASVFCWIQESGKSSLKDDDRSGIPAMNINKDNISPVKKCFRKIHSQLPRGWVWSRVNMLNGAQREAHKMVAEMLK